MWVKKKKRKGEEEEEERLEKLLGRIGFAVTGILKLVSLIGNNMGRPVSVEVVQKLNVKLIFAHRTAVFFPCHASLVMRVSFCSDLHFQFAMAMC